MTEIPRLSVTFYKQIIPTYYTVPHQWDVHTQLHMYSCRTHDTSQLPMLLSHELYSPQHVYDESITIIPRSVMKV